MRPGEWVASMGQLTFEQKYEGVEEMTYLAIQGKTFQVEKQVQIARRLVWLEVSVTVIHDGEINRRGGLRVKREIM